MSNMYGLWEQSSYRPPRYSAIWPGRELAKRQRINPTLQHIPAAPLIHHWGAGTVLNKRRGREGGKADSLAQIGAGTSDRERGRTQWEKRMFKTWSP